MKGESKRMKGAPKMGVLSLSLLWFFFESE